MEFEQLKLGNQICFPVYAASRLIIREYQPYLDALGITYPQYLVLMVLWETPEMSVNEVAQTLILNTNTITPLLKRMEIQGLLVRKRSAQDERKVMVSLSEKGQNLKLEAASIPLKLAENLLSEGFSLPEMLNLKQKLEEIIQVLSSKKKMDSEE